MRITALLSISVILALSGCTETDPTQPLVPGDAELGRPASVASHSADHRRPFEGEMVLGADYGHGACVVEVPTGDPVQPTIVVELPALVPAWGTWSHMGRVVQHIWHADCEFDPQLGALVLGGPFQVWAANGDMIEGRWTGRTYLDGSLFVHAVTENGDGRFENAAGESEVEGHVIIEPVSPTLFRSKGGAFSGTGWIAY